MTSNSLVEKVARSLARLDCEPLLMSEIEIGLYVDKRWQEKIPAAQAAIAAMEDGWRDALIAAYKAGAADVHHAWIEGTYSSEPDFTEAAHDYAAAALSPPPPEIEV